MESECGTTAADENILAYLKFLVHKKVMKQVKKQSFFIRLLAHACVSISDLKRNPAGVFKAAEGRTLLVLNHSRPAAYIIPTETWERVVDLLRELKDDEELNDRILKIGIL